MILRWTLRVLWILLILAGMQIVGLFAIAASGDLPTSVLTAQLTSRFGTPLRWTLIGFGLVALSLLVRGLLRRAIQAKSDRQALGILERLRDDEGAEVPPYLVYLRAFETTGRLKQPWFIWIWTFGIQQLRPNELESFVAGALRRLGPLVSLGEPGEHHGAGRIKTTREDWKEAVRRLVEKAVGVLIVPSDRPGTVWEIGHLREQGLLAKTVFVMPPESRGFDWRERWQRARVALGDLGPRLPEYDRHGMLFRIDTQGTILDAGHFPVWRLGRFRATVKRLLARTGPAGARPDLVSKAVRSGRRQWFFGSLWATTLLLVPLASFLHLIATAEPVLRPAERPEPWSTLWDRFEAAGRVENREFGTLVRLLANPDYQALTEGLDPGEETALRNDLRLRGRLWLEPQQLRDWYAWLARSYAGLDPGRCRRRLNGELPQADLNYVQVRLDADLIGRSADAAEAALLAGMAYPEPPDLSEAQLARAARAFLEGLAPEARARYIKVGETATDEVSDADLCWLVVTIYEGFSRLGDEHLVPLAAVIADDRLSIASAAALLDAPVEDADATPLDRLLASPAYQARIQGLDEQSRVQVLIGLANRGLVRLDDALLSEYLGILAPLAGQVPADACAQVAAGQLALDQTAPYAELPEETRQRHVQLLYAAALLEAEERRPAPALDDAAFDAAVQAFIQGLGPEGAARLETIGSSLGEPTPDDACWLFKQTYAALEWLPSPHRKTWIRALVVGRL